MNKKVIERLETIVEEISECYTSIPKEQVDELNSLTQNGWSEAEYIEYCAEYWSRSNLEETVYALLHGGKYPDNIEETIYFWKENRKIELPDAQIVQKLTADDGFGSQFGDLPVEEFLDWLQNYYSDWDIRKEEPNGNSFRVTFSNEKIAEEEYGKSKYTMLKVYNYKVFALLCCNLYEDEKKDIFEFAKQHHIHIFER